MKIAILAEKYAPDPRWYVNVILKLISIAGDYVADDIWHRLVQVITNDEKLHQYAALTIFEVSDRPVWACLCFLMFCLKILDLFSVSISCFV